MSNENNIRADKTNNENMFRVAKDLHRLAELLEKYAPHDARFDLSNDGLHIYKASKETKEATYTLAQPGMCIVAQGAKSVSLTNNHYDYDSSNIVVYAAEVPINVKVVEASKDKPYLCLVIPIEPQKLAELIEKIFPHGVQVKSDIAPIYIGQSKSDIVKSAIRIMELIVNQENVDLLVPLMIEEILIRLLRGSMGPSIAQIGLQDSSTHKVSKAINWLKKNFNQTIKMEEIANIAGMSLSPFYTHFKKLTLMSPLQYQKTLRLEEARNIIASRMMDVSCTSTHVGYSSVSQFSREYRRHFGHSPTYDIAKNQ